MTKVLIVDDDVQATTLLGKILTLDGYETVSVNDSSQAMQVAKSTAPDLILLDLMMPDPNGFEVCKMLRADANFIQTPIIIITALDDGESKNKAYAAGASDYMVKPLNMGVLIKTIGTLTKQNKKVS